MQESSRPKIIMFLIQEIIEEVKDLTPSERCKFAFLLRNAQDENCVLKDEVKNLTQLDIVF